MSSTVHSEKGQGYAVEYDTHTLSHEVDKGWEKFSLKIRKGELDSLCMVSAKFRAGFGSMNIIVSQL